MDQSMPTNHVISKVTMRGHFDVLHIVICSLQRVEQESKGSLNPRKAQKADREKLRRDRLNEQFVDLGKALDPDRPKNDKATILADAIQVLKDLTSQLTQEKNELREEKAALKSEIDDLNVQYQQRLRCMYPWPTVDPSVAIGPPPPYSFPVAVPVPAGRMPFHASIQPYPFFPNSPPYLSYHSHCNPYAEQQSTQCLPPQSNSSINRHQSTNQHDTRNPSGSERSAGFSDVATELELKIPGSSVPSNVKPSVTEQKEGRRGNCGSFRVREAATAAGLVQVGALQTATEVAPWPTVSEFEA
ncbi:Transcription factor bHLH121 [Apostasia shenzhenica]|uniref:Transcription factor bHLH121 n=1 Tax=Apostasia shenzhenica TaxID=1088818 RepID=A0A2I0ALU8_9ASPA|nr:Transcription factor bHLH121 [Apostasia shenzhenica]